MFLNQITIKEMYGCPAHTMSTWCRGLLAPLILNFDSRWVQVLSFAPPLLYDQRKRLRYALHRRLGGF
jgi:hypothetical protein